MKIWGRLKDHKPEVIDTCAKSQVDYMVFNYQMAFGRSWKVWSGRMKDEPPDEPRRLS